MRCCGLETVIIFGLFHYGSAIVCYECNSAINTMCSDAILPENLKRNCSDHDRGVTHTLCRKIVQHVEFDVNGHMPTDRVIRSCGWDETKYKGACYHRSGFGGRQEVCSCTKDLCNSAHGHHSSIFMAFTSLVIVFVHKYVTPMACSRKRNYL
ncbi:uncharacterized protein LOC112050656 [Bicyclus anynana]|uniref:Uncharacterized protein LOC112050656 n=1 Tax=Bicyclus anynana TaxID=110368 RepID=A0A6J1NIC4_BICAN|nr:uncharacterized protein LOC112050656 [Bicyclus anynana]